MSLQKIPTYDQSLKVLGQKTATKHIIKVGFNNKYCNLHSKTKQIVDLRMLCHSVCIILRPFYTVGKYVLILGEIQHVMSDPKT